MQYLSTDTSTGGNKREQKEKAAQHWIDDRHNTYGESTVVSLRYTSKNKKK
jgi:hypothetical protein